MSDHEFEKKVQSSLEQLRLRPSVAVWAEVERNIRRDKRRRRMIVWLPICLLFLGAGGYFMLQSDHPSEKQSVAVQNTIPSSSNTNTSDNTSTQSTAGTTPDNKQTPVATEQQQPESPASVATIPQPDVKANFPAVTDKTISEPKAIIKGSQPLVNKHQPDPDQKETSPYIKPGRKKQPVTNNDQLTYHEPATKQVLPVTGHDTAAGKEGVTAVTVANDATTITDTTLLADNKLPDSTTAPLPVATFDSTALAAVTPADSIKKVTEPLVKQPDSQAIAAIQPIPLQRQKSGRWQWGVQAEAGFTGITQKGLFGGLFNFLSSNSAVEKVADLSSSPNFSASNGLSVAAPQFPRPVNRASEITMGPSFGIGGFVQRTFSKRFSLSVGLQYAYLSTRTVVGNKVDSFRAVNRQPATVQLVNSYYDANNTENYSNKYHFIEIPVTLHTKLNKGVRMPLVWDVGVSASYMIGTTALHYDGLGGVYYKDNALFNKMQWVAATGFNIGLFQKTKHPLSVGPSVRYNMTNLLQKDYNTGQHLWSVGLKATVLLKK